MITGQNLVDSIAQNDTIESVKIVRLGKIAKEFDAPNVFEAEFLNTAKKEEERLAKLKETKRIFLDSMGFTKAVATSSGLKILSFKKGDGNKVTTSREISIFYTLKTAYGQLIKSNEGKEPLKFIMDKQPLIAGWREGILTMKQGGKVRLFIPYYIGFGESRNAPVPPKSDLVLDLEVLKVSK